MDGMSAGALVVLCMLLGVGAASLVWHLLGRTGTWYEACALGLLGGAGGALKGLFMSVPMQGDGPYLLLVLAVCLSALFAWLASRR